ncbi:uncharacterized protein LOC124445062 [Xenia sp. Carnegie-2017]|uniref:uncharacterized protein LOC124445062 n=1 Tax=Xenia sp. Carnegie-2017 TaxID=2897299 RepID=UPI001F03ECED|nr:uncharacterized protein LOC124445062 [Xenia sp. Carnegie-2017]
MNVNAVDAINYFSEKQLQSEIEKEQVRRNSIKRSDSQNDQQRNTILMVPSTDSKPSLARLGETHCSNCHPERETAYAFRLPPIDKSTSILFSNITLRLKTVTLNPFPSQTDASIYECFQHHPLLTLRSAQKYFFPSKSYVK